MALKCKILQFAASPLLNPEDGKPYYDGVSEEVKPYVMYTDASKYQERWDAFAKACDDFYNALLANGQYALVTADIPKTANTAAKKVVLSLGLSPRLLLECINRDSSLCSCIW